jgi:Transglutaminase-like enzymes, putative cysteine proteases
LPTAEEKARAEALRETYSEEKLVILNKLEEFTFGHNDKSEKVEVRASSKMRLMSIGKTDHSETFAEFYDEESEIEKIEVFNKKKKKVTIYVKDDYYQSDEFFYTDARVKYFNLNFSEAGFQYQVNADKRYKDIKYFTSAYFSDAYPVESTTLRFIIPRWLDLELKGFNFEGHSIKREVTYDSKADADVYEFTLNDLAARSKERFSPGPSHVYPHVLVIAKSFLKDNKTIPLFGTTEDLYGWYSSLVNGMEDDSGVLNDKVAELTKGARTDQEKVEAIYYWVQDNVRYIAFEDGIAGFRPELCQNVFKNKYGDCKGMANLTKHMLEIAGFDARLTWIGTKRIAYDYSIPSLAVDNHMICTVILDGQTYFLDPTESYNAFGEYAERIQGRQAMIEDGKKFIIKKIPISTKEDNGKINNIQVKITDEKLVGTGTQIFKGESRSSFQYRINQIENDKRENAIEFYITEGDKSFTISEVKTSDRNIRGGDFTIDYDFVLKNQVSVFGEEMYIDLDYDKAFNNFEFEDTRKSDYLFPYKIFQATNVTLDIPEGYVVSELPEGISETHPDFSFSVSFKEEGNKIIYKNIITVDRAIIIQKDFERWNKIIQQLSEFYQQQIVLKTE